MPHESVLPPTSAHISSHSITTQAKTPTPPLSARTLDGLNLAHVAPDGQVIVEELEVVVLFQRLQRGGGCSFARENWGQSAGTPCRQPRLPTTNTQPPKHSTAGKTSHAPCGKP